MIAGLRHLLPRWARAVLGLACVAVGVVLVLRPFTSLSALVFLAGLAAILTGLTRWAAARRTLGRWDDAVAVGWVLLGVAVLVWRDLSVRGVAVVVGVAVIVSALVELTGVLHGPIDERLASLLRGVASLIFGVLALAWPDVTLLVVAVLFGARTVLFGVSELAAAWRGATRREEHAIERGRVHRAGSVAGAAAALVVALVLGGVSAAIHHAEPVVDDFYDAPEDVPDDPGVLLRVEPFTREIPDQAKAWRILYTTTRDNGVPALASALVIAPAGSPTEPRPVLAWAHGTTGVARHCAPSVLPEPLESGAFFALEPVLRQGWVLVATDYIGLGTDGVHPYLIGHSGARSVLDAVRAARHIDDIELADRTVVWGHSQGGGAALWTGQLAPAYAPDVDVLGVAALAPAADLPSLGDALTQMRGGSIFASYVLTGYAGTYADVRFGDYVRPASETVVRGLAERCLSEPAILVSVLTSITTNMSVFSADLRSGPLGERLAENVPNGPFEMPLLIAQGAADTLVLPGPQAAHARTLCDGGADVEYRSYESRDHVGLVTADSPLIPELISWTQQRFAGDPTTSTCPPAS